MLFFLLVSFGGLLGFFEYTSILLFSKLITSIINGTDSTVIAVNDILTLDFTKSEILYLYCILVIISVLLIFMITLCSNVIGVIVFDNLLKSYLERSYLSFQEKSIAEYQSILFEEVRKLQERFIGALSIVIHRTIFLVIIAYFALGRLNFLDNETIMYDVMPAFLLLIIVIFFASKFLRAIGGKSIRVIRERYSVVTEALSAWRIVRLREQMNEVRADVYKYGFLNGKFLSIITTVSSSTRYMVEISTILIIWYISIDTMHSIDLENSVFYGVAIFRILPSVSSLLSNYTIAVSSLKSYHLIKVELTNTAQKDSKNKLSEVPHYSGMLNTEYSFVLEDINLKIDGQHILINMNCKLNNTGIVVIHGKSGSGKSTFLNMLMGFIQPDSGLILFHGQSYSDVLSNTVNKFGLVEQHYNNLTGTVRDNIQNIKDATVKDLMGVLFNIQTEDDVSRFLAKSAKNLSGGELQRLALLREYSFGKRILFLDEFGSGLDDITLNRVTHWLKSRENLLIFWVSHQKHVISIADQELNFDAK